MRKILLSAVLLLACLDMQADGSNIISSTSKRVVRIVEEGLPFDTIRYIKGGVNLNSVVAGSWGRLMLSSQNIPGFHIVYGAERPFKQLNRACLFWGYEVGGMINSYSSDGEALDETNMGDASWPYNYDISEYGFRVTPKVGFKLGGPKFSIGVDAGCYVSYSLYRTYTCWDEIDSDHYEYNLYVDVYDPLMSYMTNEVWNNFDAGIFIGAGLWIKKFYMGLRFSRGFMDPFSGHEGDDDRIVFFTEEGRQYSYVIPIGYGAVRNNVYISFAFQL